MIMLKLPILAIYSKNTEPINGDLTHLEKMDIEAISLLLNLLEMKQTKTMLNYLKK